MQQNVEWRFQVTLATKLLIPGTSSSGRGSETNVFRGILFAEKKFPPAVKSDLKSFTFCPLPLLIPKGFKGFV